MASPLKNLFFDGAQIRVPLQGPGVHPQFPESLVVAQLRTDAMHEAAVYAATGRAMAAAGEMLEALQLVAAKLGSRPYGTGSYLPKPIRDKVIASVEKALGTKGGV